MEEYEVYKLQIDKGLTLKEISNNLNVSISTVKRRLKFFKLNSKSYKIKSTNFICIECECEFSGYIKEDRKFCSRSCSTSFNNRINKQILDIERKKIKVKKECINCKTETKNAKFCNRICYENNRKQKRNVLIEIGKASSDICKTYLIEKYGEKCMDCEWNKINIITGRVPIEIEHIDGNSENNNLENLKLLCPNCHSLTPTYKALNSGNGRHTRRERYKEGKSF